MLFMYKLIIGTLYWQDFAGRSKIAKNVMHCISEMKVLHATKMAKPNFNIYVHDSVGRHIPRATSEIVCNK
jgi:hypothetical protein